MEDTTRLHQKPFPTYKQQFDKITTAYIQGEIKPFDAEFCFCGTLAGNWEWGMKGSDIRQDYSYRDFGMMEAALLKSFQSIGLNYVGICSISTGDGGYDVDSILRHKDYEDLLFKGMCDALDVLKEIHESKGEIIDEVPAFTKRELKTA